MVTLRRVGGLALSEAGLPDGRPVLFLHGIGSSRAAFDAQLAHFSPNRWCLAPDAPGYGESTDDLTIAGLGHYVDHVRGTLDSLDVADADVVGVSWGGVIAARLAAEHPERVCRLVLADSSRGSGVDPERAATMRTRADALRAEGSAALAAARTPRLLSPGASQELIDAVADDMAAAIRLPGYGQAAEAMADTDHTELLTTITAPTLVLVGEHDVVCPPAEAEILTSTIPNATLVVIPEAGHLANRERPDSFNQAVEAFFERTRPDTEFC